MPTGPNPFVARLLRRAHSLRVRADRAVEGARHLRMLRYRQRSSGRSMIPDETAEARLRRELGPPVGDARAAAGDTRPHRPPGPTLPR